MNLLEMIAAYMIVALQFRVGNKMLIIDAYKHRSVLNAQDADVAPTSVGVTYFRFMKCVKTINVLYMCTTNTFAHC